MKKTKYIDPKNLPFRMPISGTALWFLVMERINPSSFWWGVWSFFISLVWIIWCVNLFISENIDIFEEKK